MKHKHPQQKIADSKDRVGCLLFYGLDWLQEPSRRQNKKFFDPTIFQKCWRGVGEQPTFAKQMKLYRNLQVKSKRESEESQLPCKLRGCNEGQGFRGNCDSQGKLGMCPSLAEPDSGGFSKKDVSNYEPQAAKSLCHAFGTRRGW